MYLPLQCIGLKQSSSGLIPVHTRIVPLADKAPTSHQTVEVGDALTGCHLQQAPGYLSTEQYSEHIDCSLWVRQRLHQPL